MLSLHPQYESARRIETLVENRTKYALENAELNVFETQLRSQNVHLCFPYPVLASMIKGKKIMHLSNEPAFKFLPGESVILPSGELMRIDFPEAASNNPTQCLALAINPEMIQKAITTLNIRGLKDHHQEWVKTDANFHFINNEAITHIIQRLIYIFSENHPSKDVFADLMLQELIIRIIQQENKLQKVKQSYLAPNNDRVAYIISYIRSNIEEQLTIDELSSKVYMSTSGFYRMFKHEIGCSPNDFIIEERIKMAERILANPTATIKEAYMASGFSSFSYFCRMFKKKKSISPSDFRNQFVKS